MIVNGTFINHQYIEENPELIFEERLDIDEYFEENPGLRVRLHKGT
jgi:hypothetical protein